MSDKTKKAAESEASSLEFPAQALPVCGIVMPISAIDGCSEAHWSEVYSILESAIGAAGFRANLVSNANDVGIIQQRIIQNLYDNPIVVCDVSAKNPNVMFELGMRLAFDKPTIIVKDDKTSYSFDTSPIEHLEYPRDLRFSRIVDFREHLTAKVKATFERATKDPNYTTFLKHFGTFKVAQLETQVLSKEDFVLEELRTLTRQVSALARASRPGHSSHLDATDGVFTIHVGPGSPLSEADLQEFVARSKLPFRLHEIAGGTKIAEFRTTSAAMRDALGALATEIVNSRKKNTSEA